ncbi:MAG: hypothetical protein ABIV51_12515 [Saprospiraceae bacterium]
MQSILIQIAAFLFGILIYFSSPGILTINVKDAKAGVAMMTLRDSLQRDISIWTPQLLEGRNTINLDLRGILPGKYQVIVRQGDDVEIRSFHYVKIR